MTCVTRQIPHATGATMVFSPVLYAMTYRTCRMSAEAAVVRGALSRCVCRNILSLSDVVRYCRLSVRRIQSSIFRHTQQRRSHASLGLLIVPHRVVYALTCVIRQMRHALLSRVMMCFLMYVRTHAPQHLNWHCRCVAPALRPSVPFSQAHQRMPPHTTTPLRWYAATGCQTKPESDRTKLSQASCRASGRWAWADATGGSGSTGSTRTCTSANRGPPRGRRTWRPASS